jgi:modulator of FtsH protease HflK
VKLLAVAGTCVLALGALAGLYVQSGYVQIATGEEAIVLQLGRYSRTFTAGPNWHLPGLETLERERVTNRRLEFGFRTEESEASPVESTDTDSPAPEIGERTTDERQEARMVTGDENLVDVQFVLEYDIIDLRTFRLNVADATGVIRDATLAAVRSLVAQRTVDEVLYGARRAIQEDAQARVEAMLRSYLPPGQREGPAALGISVVSVLFRDVAAPEAVSEAFRDMASAQQDSERARLEANGYRNEVLPRARGEAQALIAEAEAYRARKILAAEGETTRFLALLTEYRKAPAVTRSRLYLEALEAILPKMDKIIMQDSGERILPYLPLGGARRAAPIPPAQEGAR